MNLLRYEGEDTNLEIKIEIHIYNLHSGVMLSLSADFLDTPSNSSVLIV